MWTQIFNGNRIGGTLKRIHGSVDMVFKLINHHYIFNFCFYQKIIKNSLKPRTWISKRPSLSKERHIEPTLSIKIKLQIMGLVHPELPDFYNRGGITYQIQELKYKDGKIYNKFTQIEML